MSDNVKATYRWLADGTKAGVKDVAGTLGYEYMGSLVYHYVGGVLQLESAAFGGGRIIASSGSTTPNYFITDHLGSTRVIFDPLRPAAEQDLARYDYMPLGQSRNATPLLSLNRWTFSGKEEQTTGALTYFDFGARFYDSRLGRWTSIDPLADTYYGISPYAYCANNSIRLIDPNGMWFGDPNGSFAAFWRGFWGSFPDRSDVQAKVHERLDKPTVLLNDLNELCRGTLTLVSDVTGISNIVTGRNQTAEAVGNAVQTVANIPNMSAEEMGALTADVAILAATVVLTKKMPATTGGLNAAKGGNAFRYVAEGELNAIRETGMLRGGRPGETFFTKDVYKSASKAQNRLALPDTPTLRVEFEILNNPPLLQNGTKVLPANGMIGGGAEFMTIDPVRVRLINWQSLK